MIVDIWSNLPANRFNLSQTTQQLLIHRRPIYLVQVEIDSYEGLLCIDLQAASVSARFSWFKDILDAMSSMTAKPPPP